MELAVLIPTMKDMKNVTIGIASNALATSPLTLLVIDNVQHCNHG